MNEQQLRRLSDVEVYLNKYHDQLNLFISQVVNYNKQIVSKDEISKIVKEYNEKLNHHFNQINKEFSELHQEHVSHQKEIDDLQKQMNNYHSVISKHDVRIDSDRISIDQNRDKCSAFERRILALENSFKEFLRFRQIFEENHKTLMLMIENINKVNNDLQKKLQACDHKANTADSKNDQMKYVYDQKMKDFWDMINKLNNKVQNMQVDMTAHLKDAIEKTNNRISNIQPVAIPALPNFERKFAEIKDALLKEVEKENSKYVKALDLSQLNDIQMRVMDKKLEKILSLLSKNNML